MIATEDLAVFAYVLMDNHFHVVARRGAAPLGHCLRRLLTGHSVVFNRRHRRSGHLFQNRYRAVLCEADSYLLQLVRYVHLNPVRAGLVTEPQTYRWSSHAAYLRRGAPAWLAVQPVLEMAGARRELQRELEQGRAAELPGLAQKMAARQSGRTDWTVRSQTVRLHEGRWLAWPCCACCSRGQS